MPELAIAAQLVSLAELCAALELLLAVLSQQRMDRPLPEQMAAQRRRVEQLTIRARRSLHPTIVFDPRPERESSAVSPDCSAVS